MYLDLDTRKLALNVSKLLAILAVMLVVLYAL
jgi:hypothetical protein